MVYYYYDSLTTSTYISCYVMFSTYGLVGAFVSSPCELSLGPQILLKTLFYCPFCFLFVFFPSLYTSLLYCTISFDVRRRMLPLFLSFSPLLTRCLPFILLSRFPNHRLLFLEPRFGTSLTFDNFLKLSLTLLTETLLFVVTFRSEIHRSADGIV